LLPCNKQLAGSRCCCQRRRMPAALQPRLGRHQCVHACSGASFDVAFLTHLTRIALGGFMPPL
jgi:hypothetical protein